MNEFEWIKKYNKLFEVINKKETDAYFSGPRFLKLIKEFDTSFLDYTQYIEYRRTKGLNTSRKNYFYDILTMFHDDVREKIIKRIYEIVKNDTKHIPKPEIKIDNDILGKANINEENEFKTSSEVIKNPTLFISYSWDDEAHNTWILNLANRLGSNGVEVILDRYEMQAGKNILHFMEQALEKSDKVLVIFTENYKLKADNRKGGVGYEYSILNNELYKNIINNAKYIPILKAGTFETSIPSFMQQFLTIDMTDDSQYEEKIREITLAIYNKPIIEKPIIGNKPDYI